MAREKRKAGGAQKKKKGRRDDEEYQKPGKLMLNNPLIPAAMDEDIDDDLAFDSEDEALYGQFFSKPESKAASKVKTNRRRHSEAVDDDTLEQQFSAIDKAEKGKRKRHRGRGDDDDALYNYREDGQSSGDDNDDDFIDLTDMFDLTMKEQQQQQQRQRGAAVKNKKKKTEQEATSGAAAPMDGDGEVVGRRVARKLRGAQVTEEEESLYGMAAAGVDGGASSFGSALRTFVKSQDNENAEESAVRQRLRESMGNKHNLLSMDAEDSTKDRVTRREVRSVVEKNLEKYKPLLHELNTAKHVQFPMKAPDSTPTPSTIGGIVAAAEARFSCAGGTSARDRGGALASSKGAGGAAGKLAVRMGDLLSRAGLSRGQLQEEGGGGSKGVGGVATEKIGDYVQFDEDGNGDNDFDQREGSGAGEDGAPSRSYVAKLKAMLAYENSRRKRFNRIKSKTYRRILRKEKDRERERREKAFELLHPELARKRLAEKLLKARAEERVTQKHKNTSAWVKHAKRFADFDANAKDAINEQHALHQRLMQKMEQDAGEDNYERYLADGSDGDSAASNEEDRVVDELFAATAAEARDGKAGASAGKSATSLLWRSVEEDEGGAQGGGGAGGERSGAMQKARAELGQMKFMKAAREREEKEYETQMQALQDDIRRYQNGEDIAAADSEEDVDPSTSTDANGKAKHPVSGAAALGRMSFAAAKKGGASATATTDGVVTVESIRMKKQSGLRADDDSAHDDGDTEGDDISEVVSLGSKSSESGDADALTEGGSATQLEQDSPRGCSDQMKRKTPQGEAGEAASKKIAKKAKKASGTRQEVTKDVFAGLRKEKGGAEASFPKKQATSTRVVVKPSRAVAAKVGVSSSSATVAASHEEDKDFAAKARDDDLKMHQEYLISRAFAHDDVDEEFLKDKEAQVEAIMRPEDRNDNLPGWGEWGGEDARLNRRHQEKLAHTGIQKQIERTFLMKSRADAALDHVIINHDGVELVPDRMTLHMVPRPFSNPQEFARSMRQPLGPEWSSALGFKEGVQPRVEVQQGHSVLPLDISLRGKKRSTTKRRKGDVRGQ